MFSLCSVAAGFFVSLSICLCAVFLLCSFVFVGGSNMACLRLCFACVCVGVFSTFSKLFWTLWGLISLELKT